jgi:hypothetical protein
MENGVDISPIKFIGNIKGEIGLKGPKSASIFLIGPRYLISATLIIMYVRTENDKATPRFDNGGAKPNSAAVLAKDKKTMIVNRYGAKNLNFLPTMYSEVNLLKPSTKRIVKKIKPFGVLLGSSFLTLIPTIMKTKAKAIKIIIVDLICGDNCSNKVNLITVLTFPLRKN